MSEQIVCPNCHRKQALAEPVGGNVLQCRYCAFHFAAEAAAAGGATPDQAPHFRPAEPPPRQTAIQPRLPEETRLTEALTTAPADDGPVAESVPGAGLGRSTRTVTEPTESASRLQPRQYDSLRRPSYAWYLVVLSALPLGIPAVLITLRGNGLLWSWGGALWLILALGLTGACLALARAGNRSVVGRTLGCAGLPLFGYLAVFLFSLLHGSSGVKDRPQEVPADPELEAAVDYCERCERAGIQEVPADPELEAAAWPAPVTPPTWKVFDHPHGRFSVRMPARPETAWGFLPGNYVDVAYLYTLAREAPNLSFTVGYATVGDFTHLPNSPKTPEQLLAVLRDKLVEQAKGKLLRQQTINLDSHPGMEVEVEATQPAAGISRARLYLIRDRLYQLQVAGTKEQVFSLDADVFFGSFQLKGKDPAVYRGKPASYWVEMLQHPEWMNHERAVRALNRMNPEARQAVLAEARAAVYALGMDFLFRGRQEGVIRALAYLGPLAEEAAPLLVQQIKVQRHDSIDEALVKIGPLAVPVLVRDLRVAENDSRILVSMTLLGRIGSAAKAAGSALVPLLKHQKLRLFAAEALLRIGAPEAKEALPILVEATQTGKFVGLPFLGSVGREALPIVAAALKSDQPYVRAEAAATLIQIDPANAEALALLKEFLKGGEPNASIVAARALLRRDAKDKEALFVLAERLRQRQGQSALIVESLAELGPAAREAVPALCQAVTWEDPRQPFNVQGTRFPALKALLRIDPEGCAPVLMQLLKDKDAFVRYRTFAALEEIGPKAPQLVPVIVVALKDMNSYVRETAADYLALLGPAAREAIPALTEATKDPVVNVREAAAQALKDIARNP